jgi:hypothetical protein
MLAGLERIVATRLADDQPGRSNIIRQSWRAASTSATPVLFAGMENTDRAFGYLSKRLQMRDCGLFGRPRSHDPLLAIWLDGFNPIGAA